MFQVFALQKGAVFMHVPGAPVTPFDITSNDLDRSNFRSIIIFQAVLDNANGVVWIYRLLRNTTKQATHCSVQAMA